MSGASHYHQGVELSGTVSMFNCTVYGCYWGIYGPGTLINCIVGGSYTVSTDFNGTQTITNYCSDEGLGSNPQGPSGSDWDNEFTDKDNGDFSLEAGSNCINNGTDNPGSDLYLDDITGAIRTSTWDIGAFEYAEGTVLGLAGTIVGVSEVTGDIGANPVSALSLAGTVAGTSGVTGAVGANPVTVPSLAGTVAGTSRITGAIGANPVSVLGLAGTVTGVSSVTGAVRKTATLYLAGTVTGVSSVTGAIGANPVVVSSLAGEIVGVSSVSGSVDIKAADVIHPFPSTRSSDYDPDLVFDDDTGTWTDDEDLLARDGSRHKTQLVCVGKDLIYYGAID